MRGGAFGVGLSRNVRECYRFLVENYEPGDELFFFGFSRGAFTARSPAGMVRNSGILRREHANRLDDAFALYRSRDDARAPRGTKATLFRRSFSHEPRIHFIGVWDTVGALGIPVIGLGLAALVNRRWGFHDTALSRTVDLAYHALAIDEERGPFVPAMWHQQARPASRPSSRSGSPGAHSDVGGGTRGPVALRDPPAVDGRQGRRRRARLQCGVLLRPGAPGGRHERTRGGAVRRALRDGSDPPVAQAASTRCSRAAGGPPGRSGCLRRRTAPKTVVAAGQAIASSAAERVGYQRYGSDELREFLATDSEDKVVAVRTTAGLPVQ